MVVTRSVRGCWTCKRMKLKCGEEKPRCLRCTKANRDCPGYPPTPDLFRHAKLESGKLVWPVNHRRRSGTSIGSSRSRSSDTTQSYSFENLEVDAALSPQLDRLFSPLSPSLPLDWEQFALKHFFYFHTMPCQPGSVLGGYMSFLEDFCSGDDRPSYLQNALRAAALVSIDYLTDSEKPRIKAMAHRSKAFNALWPVMSDEKEARTDEVLTTCFLLEHLELMTGENQTSKVWFNHSPGISALLRLRGPSQVETDIGSQLFYSANSRLVAKDFAFGTDLSYTEYATHAIYTKTLLYQSRVAGRLVNLRRALGKAGDGNSKTSRSNISSILKSAIELEKVFDTWPALAPPEVHLADPTPSSTLLHNTYNSFPTLEDAIAWNFYWYFRLRVFRIQVDCLKTIAAASISPSPDLTVCEHNLIKSITQSADQICTTFPFLVGEVDERGKYRPKTPLRVRGAANGCTFGMAGLNTIISTPELDRTRPEMRDWAFAQLYQVSDRLGLKQMSAFARFYQARIQAKERVRNLLLDDC